MKTNVSRIVLFSLALILIGSSLFFYFSLLNEGKEKYFEKSEQVNTMVEDDPTFFNTVFSDIFPAAIQCSENQTTCASQTRKKFDLLSSEANNSTNKFSQQESLNQQPIYFITLLPDGQIGKLFFSGEVMVEPVNTREEKLVVELLTGKRDHLYGPYFNSEVFDFQNRSFFDPKPAYLKDLYSQMEVIVPYYSDSEIIGGIVYLHGE